MKKMVEKKIIMKNSDTLISPRINLSEKILVIEYFTGLAQDLAWIFFIVLIIYTLLKLSSILKKILYRGSSSSESSSSESSSKSKSKVATR